LPVPNHLRSGTYGERKNHGIGVGYRNPHEFEGHDVEQAYLPTDVAGKRYYHPSDQGSERGISERLAALAATRAAARERGRAPKNPEKRGPGGGVGDVMRTRASSLADIARTEKRDAGDSS
jgi:MgsA AAA+ ATPase C terminal